MKTTAWLQWQTTSNIFKEGWLTRHGFHPSYAIRNWDNLPEYVKKKWESES